MAEIVQCSIVLFLAFLVPFLARDTEPCDGSENAQTSSSYSQSMGSPIHINGELFDFSIFSPHTTEVPQTMLLLFWLETIDAIF